MKALKKIVSVVAVVAASSAMAQDNIQPGVGSDTRYATDAYPGFDNESEIVKPSKKEPKWFAWINGPNRDTAVDQFAYCEGLEAAGDFKKAAKHYDALVREWPASPEAPKAQEALARLLSEQLEDYEEALKEYRYLADFYSVQCDYLKAADQMYKMAGLMRIEGKTIVFFRFRNTVDVRRAFESCVLRAPGAAWVPEAMLTIGDLREEEEKDGEAVKVYENLRNLHFETPQAKQAIFREAEARMRIIRRHEYNRERCVDTIAFLKLAVTQCEEEAKAHIMELLDEAKGMLENDAWRSTNFYDSRTRTKRSAVSAYERFLAEYPEGVHAEAARARLAELKGEGAEEGAADAKEAENKEEAK